MFSISFRKHRDEEKKNNLLTFSMLAPSLRQQRVLVLYLHRVIETRFLTLNFLGLFSSSMLIYTGFNSGIGEIPLQLTIKI